MRENGTHFGGKFFELSQDVLCEDRRIRSGYFGQAL
jgi:hypothetical protein